MSEDAVDHPPHYVSHPSGVECITITEAFNFCLGNAIKYIWRAGLKGDAKQDLEKARWYVDREIQRLSEDTGSPWTDVGYLADPSDFSVSYEDEADEDRLCTADLRPYIDKHKEEVRRFVGEQGPELMPLKERPARKREDVNTWVIAERLWRFYNEEMLADLAESRTFNSLDWEERDAWYGMAAAALQAARERGMLR